MNNTFCATQLSCLRQNKKIFSDLSFELNAGELLLVEGPNGSGKSSLLQLLAGLVTPMMGHVFWKNASIYSIHTPYFKHLHYIAHTNGIKLGLTVDENIKLAALLSQCALSTSYQAALSDLQLYSLKHLPAKLLSAGQKRRLALAKLFLFPKAIWILDEPLTALDIATQTLFLSHLSTHLNTGGIAVISSHHSLLFEKLASHTVRLNAC